MFVKLSDNHWGTKQSHIVPSCLWSCLTTIEVLNSLALSHRVCEVIWQPLRYQTVSFYPIVFVQLSDNRWGTKQSHFVPSCLWSCLTTIEVLNSLALSLMFVKLSDNHWGTKQSHFVPSCLWSCHTSLDLLLNSLTLCHRFCEVVWQPLRY